MMTETENLARWRDSGDPHRWVWSRSASLLVRLRAGEYWPMSEDDIEKTLEAAAETYLDLKRWNLLKEVMHERTCDLRSSPEDEEIWF